MTHDVQKAVKQYRSATGEEERSRAEEKLWLAMAAWRDSEVIAALKRCAVICRNNTGGDAADIITELIDQRQSEN